MTPIEMLKKTQERLSIISTEELHKGRIIGCEDDYKIHHDSFEIANMCCYHFGADVHDVSKVTNIDLYLEMKLPAVDYDYNNSVYIDIYRDLISIEKAHVLKTKDHICFEIDTKYFKDMSEEEYFQFSLISDVCTYISFDNISKLIMLSKSLIPRLS